ncbi:hypothetical protein ACH5RR_006703 [Cinchona calisaya]|uniref:Protein kinase domain-containing protein n=1 Tax=Cinchona calisaya TaxID=153742 RepID=A0ABD3APQ7_9GENT
MMNTVLLLKVFTVCLALLFVEAVSLRPDKPEKEIGNPKKGHKCDKQFQCGKILINVRYPFRVGGSPEGCGYPNVQLSCDFNRTVLYLGSNSNKYYVEEDSIRSFGTNSNTIRVIDPGVQKNNCSSFPLYSITHDSYNPLHPVSPADSIIFVSCKKPVKSPHYIDTYPWLTAKDFSNVISREGINYSYVVVGKNLVASSIEESCTIHRTITSQFQRSLDVGTRGISFRDIHEVMASGFELQWLENTHGFCSSESCPISVGGRVLVGIFFIIAVAFLIYKCRRGHLLMQDAVEKFLRSRQDLIPVRYSYKQIKKMSNSFKEKLGEGGYGSVYKGKLRSGQFVAIKMLNNKSQANGQDFINEVATLGRIHHVNVVRLVGFCASTSKRALVYDYMPNGSLDKFIFADWQNGISLSWNNAFQIAKGVARGMQYLHQGCNMQILHFDIKPHNVLLDENFVPKISDFGLAKLRPMQKGVVTLTVVRGTLGYMAPELFYRTVGEVSYKADVYSFGMLLMEMAGRRRNLNAHAQRSSQVFFPTWIYDKFHQGEEDIATGDHITTLEDKNVASKFVIIALWCIQMRPEDRPSMKGVLEMLERDLEDLQLPPKPRFYPSHSSVFVQRSSHSCSEESMERI